MSKLVLRAWPYKKNHLEKLLILSTLKSWVCYKQLGLEPQV